MTYEKAQDVFDQGFTARFKPEAAANLSIAYHFDITGAGKWCVSISNGKLSIQPGDCSTDSHLTLAMTEADFLDLANGREGIQLLFMTGRLRVDGDLPSALKLVQLFPAETV